MIFFARVHWSCKFLQKIINFFMYSTWKGKFNKKNWNWTQKNIHDWQQCVQFRKSKKCRKSLHPILHTAFCKPAVIFSVENRVKDTLHSLLQTSSSLFPIQNRVKHTVKFTGGNLRGPDKAKSDRTSSIYSMTEERTRPFRYCTVHNNFYI